ncbi:molybdenum cofactor guanylyltransferase [Infirmifilum sp. NZ]|uniref:molybdenum cofactor guanylyltransferase n=1 Tax=Infirmifilum sp. NZ TaxID=2926850 RepID=UPI0027A75AD6|nr:molybdenum cofactor guanylyltransferase [Infirmifilum sp. NZ]UNQ74147.1 molybdenum cofactor guanylyltransferase [Infirmifilum sp. NZ]
MNLVVLAGGAGRRLGGVYKPLLELCGKPMILRILEAMSGYFDKVTVIVHDAEQIEAVSKIATGLGLRVDVVRDILEVASPLSGLYTASLTVKEGIFAVIPADTPFIRGKTMKALHQLLDDENDAVVPRWPNGYVEPLIAVYRREAVRRALSNAALSSLRVSWLLENIRTKYVSVEEISENPRLEFFNVNTRDDLEVVQRLCHENCQFA